MPVRPRRLSADRMKNPNLLPNRGHHKPARGTLDRKMRRFLYLLLMMADLAAMTVVARAQAPAQAEALSETSSKTLSENRSETAGSTTAAPGNLLMYTRPTEKTKLRYYAFDAFGPYPIVGAAFTAGINQVYNTPPEWKQGAAGYGKRFGSDFGIAVVSTTTRYALAEVFREDTLYYRCECRGVFPRLRHAMISTFTARRGSDGHSVFSFPALVAPYAGAMTAVYAWYPGRYNAEDGLRMGNYSLLAYAGENLAMEFLYWGPHSLLSRMHLNNGRAAPSPGLVP
jgi:hypothetical protein